MKKILLLSFIFLKISLGFSQNNPPIKILGEPELDRIKLFVFVGEKISVEEKKPEVNSMDNLFIAKYKVLKVVYGKVEIDTVEFRAWDHYGVPNFAKYKNVLLYISQNKNGEWYHQKYQYSPVYQTLDGRWAAPGKDGEYSHVYNTKTQIKPEKIDFKEDLCIDISNWDKENIEKHLPNPIYKIKNSKACPKMGNYVEELLELKKTGVLRARGLF